MGCIYKETNTINGKCYIGLSTRDVVKTRHRNHMNGKGGALLLERAVAKHGRDAFVLEFLHDGILLLDELKRLEVEEIAKHNCQAPNGYNISPGGNVPPSQKGATPWNKGKKGVYSTDPELRERLAKKSKEAWANPELREQQAQRTKELWDDPNYCDLQSQRHKEAVQDPEYRQLQSEIQKEQWQDPDYREQQSKTRKEVWANPELRKRQSEIQKESWIQNPERRKQQAERTMARFASPDKEPARQLFFSLPDSMSLAEKRKHLRETFPEQHYRNIWRWVKEWINPTPAQLNLFG